MTTIAPPSAHQFAELVTLKLASFADILPLIPLARMIDVRCNFYYLQEHTELPDFELHIGDHYVQYERCRYLSSQSERLRIVLRSALTPGKHGGSGTYQNVDSRDCKLPHRRQAKRLLAALLARLKGQDPWYRNATLCSFKFANTVPMESQG
jgi:hypothetical protein